MRTEIGGSGVETDDHDAMPNAREVISDITIPSPSHDRLRATARIWRQSQVQG